MNEFRELDTILSSQDYQKVLKMQHKNLNISLNVSTHNNEIKILL